MSIARARGKQSCVLQTTSSHVVVLNVTSVTTMMQSNALELLEVSRAAVELLELTLLWLELLELTLLWLELLELTLVELLLLGLRLELGLLLELVLLELVLLGELELDRSSSRNSTNSSAVKVQVERLGTVTSIVSSASLSRIVGQSARMLLWLA